MPKIIIEGGNKIDGEITVEGAKNSVLPILAATVLCKDECILHNCPKITDVEISLEILSYLGVKSRWEGKTLIIGPSCINLDYIPCNLMECMRSSIIFLGAILSRMKKASLSLPGGCELGPRPIDLHLEALKIMGVKITQSEKYLTCSAPEGIIGKEIELCFPSVGATENIILAAVFAKGITKIKNAAQEPEIRDLCEFLNKCGAKIKGFSTEIIEIEGVDSLKGAEHTIIPDRIVATTFMSAAAITGGKLCLKSVNPCDLEHVIPIFKEAGCILSLNDDSLKIVAPQKLNRVKYIKTLPYPGFPTDAQALLMSVMTLANGESVFCENIFSGRYKHVPYLKKMGANIILENNLAKINGVDFLSGACVESTDLRGGAALVVAALAAKGKSEIGQIEHLERGYENLVEKLFEVGACIKKQ